MWCAVIAEAKGNVMQDVQVRAADADRERVLVELQRHTTAGRLTLEEYSARAADAYRARTIGELGPRPPQRSMHTHSVSRRHRNPAGPVERGNLWRPAAQRPPIKQAATIEGWGVSARLLARWPGMSRRFCRPAWRLVRPQGHTYYLLCRYVMRRSR